MHKSTYKQIKAQRDKQIIKKRNKNNTVDKSI